MNKPRTDFWFRVKRYGWGWGLPVRWQGWAVLAAYFALLYGGIRYLAGGQHVVGLVVYLIGITVAMIAIVVAKGERPVGWRWGGN
ncbi:MAG TPA: hypothetical protein VFX89_04685 [Gammaproteobacteria bacterium]|nr:hypothetical protein [Gammaproteobacteria bacterium]